ncbi:MAG: polysaccharide deacetylase family protein [Muribaculaceae bacterium]|nr:polysaccharide deacetylase family protein [Muribaculaceae bacterium]
MKNVCFYLNIHQPYRLKRYRFFDIGNDHYYYDDFANEDIISNLAERSYIPMCKTLLEMADEYGQDFKCAVSISGTAVEQLQQSEPEVIELLRKLSDKGCVEFLAGTFAHSLASIEDPEEFMRQVKVEQKVIKNVFGQTPKVFANTELIFDDEVASLIQAMGFKAAVVPGAKHILGWKSPDYVYSSATAPKLKLLFTNDKLAADISHNFNNTDWAEYPLTADKYVNWIAELPEQEQIVNIALSMDTFGGFIPASSGIFDFLKALPRFGKEMGVRFTSPSEVVGKLKAVDSVTVPYAISYVDGTRIDVSAWKGNDLQREALNKLYGIAERVSMVEDRKIQQDWEYLQGSDHFFYMATNNQADAAFSPYDSPFSAFTNYMNVLADFLVRVEEQFPENVDNEELNSLLLTIRNQSSEIEQLKKENKTLRKNILEAEDSNYARVEAVAVVEEAPAKEKKAPAKKAAKKETGEKKKPGRKPGRKPAEKKEDNNAE